MDTVGLTDTREEEGMRKQADKRPESLRLDILVEECVLR